MSQQEQLKKLTRHERRETDHTSQMMVFGNDGREAPRSQIIHLARLRKTEQPGIPPTLRLESRWYGQPGRPPARGTRTFRMCTFNTRNSGSARPPLSNFTFRPHPEADDIVLVLDPDQHADNQRKDKKPLSLFVHDRHDRKAPEGRQRATG